ncbi:hypothetical protein [Sinorhizobium fredii]|uniref:hypothetical protein n=1 Tax=Rhizobium fredii TaxID=380 RepID=UPI0013E8C51F|nr:hypothetical protein [Sinorhizobium fredii]
MKVEFVENCRYFQIKSGNIRRYFVEFGDQQNKSPGIFICKHREILGWQAKHRGREALGARVPKGTPLA